MHCVSCPALCRLCDGDLDYCDTGVGRVFLQNLHQTSERSQVSSVFKTANVTYRADPVWRTKNMK